MPSCNLVENIENKWLQASRNKNGDLYVAAVDDYINAFLQVVAYYQFSKGGTSGVGPSKEELKLRFAQCRVEQTRDPGVLQKALLDMRGVVEFCTRNPHLKGAKVFRSQKRKSDTSIRANNETHRPDTVNFSCPSPNKTITRSWKAILSTIIEEASPSMHDVAPPSPIGLGFRQGTTIQESKVNEKLWHIASLPHTFTKSCWAMQVVTKKKCIAKIVINGWSTPAPTYSRFWQQY